MADVAQLGIRIDSSSAKTAAADLTAFNTAAGKAAITTKALNDNVKQTAQQVETANKSHAQLSTSTRGLQQQFRALNDILVVTGSQLGGTALGMGRLVTGSLHLGPLLTGVSAGLAVIAGTAVAAYKAMSDLARVADTSRFSGFSSQFGLGLRGAAGQAGISTDDIVQAMQQFGINVRQAQSGVGDLAVEFRGMGRSISDSDTAFLALADRIKNAQNDVDKMRLLQIAGLPTTREWANFMSQGAAGVRQAIGAIPLVEQAQIEQAKRVEEEWNRVWYNITSFAKRAFLAISDVAIEGAHRVQNVLAGRPGDAATFSERFDASKGSLKPFGPQQKTPAELKQDQLALINQQIQSISLLGDLATANDKAKQKQLELSAAYLQTGASAGKLNDVLISQAVVQQKAADLQVKAMNGIASEADFMLQKQMEVQIQVAAGKMTWEEAAIAIENYKRHAKEAANAVEEYASKFPLLTRAIQDSTDMFKMIDTFSVGAINTLASGFTDIVTHTKSMKEAFSDMSRSILRDLTNMIIKSLLFKAVSGFTGNLFGGAGGAPADLFGTSNPGWAAGLGSGSFLKSASGNVMAGPGIGAFSNSIVSSPTIFPFATGVGLMGERGSEAVMPLRRDSRGNLGVSGGSKVTIINQRPGNDFQTKEQSDGTGMRELVITVVKQEAAKGAFDSTNAGLYSLRRRKVR